jgi:hypothetical protein
MRNYHTLTYYRMMTTEELIDCALTGSDISEHWRDLAQVLGERLQDETKQ